MPRTKTRRYHGFKSRANLTWHITPDIMAYYTFSQGFRPGGFNRTVGDRGPRTIARRAAVRIAVELRARFADQQRDRLEERMAGSPIAVNASAYRMDWKNVQFTLFDPTILGNTTFVVNGPDYRIRGVELQLAARVTDGLTIQGSSSWNSAEQTSSPCLISNEPPRPSRVSASRRSRANPTRIRSARWTPGRLSRRRWNSTCGRATTGPSTSTRPSSWPAPIISATCRTNRRAIAPGTDGGHPAPRTHLRYDQPGYTTYDASVGVAKDNWTAQFYGQNLSNSDASTFTSSAQFIESQVPLRPRVLGIKFGYKF